MLYPLKFKPLLKSQIWGGDKLIKAGKKLPKTIIPGTPIGESWEISGVDGDVSVVANGFLKSNNLEELIEVYMGELVGEKIYNTYGLEFPVLIKLIDSHDVLSVQVHPNDELAEERHNSRGKTEMWYIVDCEPGACLYVGFNRPVSHEEYLAAVDNNTLPDLLRRFEVNKGEAYYIPAGTIHAIGAGILIAEIQETSDITYRISDWGRTDSNGNPRQLHTEEALGAIDFDNTSDYRRATNSQPNTFLEIVSSPFFTTNIVNVAGEMTRDFSALDSFVAYVCIEGSIEVRTDSGNETIAALESLLLPAEIEYIALTGTGTILEVYIK